MSIRTNKMKAVPLLLKQLMIARSKFHERGRDESFDGKLEKLRLDLNKIKDVFVRVKKNEEELLDTLAEVHAHLCKLERKKLDEDMDDICKRIKDSAHKLVPVDAFDDSSKEDDHKGGQIFHSSQQLQQPYQRSRSQFNYYSLSPLLQYCLNSLVVFPQNSVIRKRNAINLWIGLDSFKIQRQRTKQQRNWNPLSNKFRVAIHNANYRGHCFKVSVYGATELRYELQLEQKKETLGDRYFGYSIHTVFNVGASYLNFRPQWVNELKNLVVLQLGRWQDSPLHHIEVESEEFLKELKNLRQLKYLSLRGISNIFELPSSIVELEKLLVLDLKACHNLETLPNDISSMKSLTHLILSKCYLLEGMPKGIEKLTNLEVLKGFVISTPGKSPYRISDLVNLKKLKRLSIHIGREAIIRDMDFQSLEGFFELKCLKISWSVSDSRYDIFQTILPPRLRKFHLECFPGKSFLRQFLPGERKGSLSSLEVNISGGKVEIMEVDFKWWKVDILRLKYLKRLNVDIDDLKSFFPELKYVEIKQISNHSYIEHEWDS
uniref:Disease resistance R13L4/SHOC-2-like LRR domain-containing protein n=1 Tax=Phaseolus vulgaris TaxID=3885 RepID=V7B1Y0_PHAVU|nr:hypothetical protein PHAVU_008G069600g [Phaseolus vulgaris]ESW11912.1 hypothetical protein PHAVU_008G069600g [Phaseolus vulgaris]